MEQKVPNNFQFNKKTETTVLPAKSSNYLMTSSIMASSSSNRTTPVAVSSSASRVSSSSGSDAQSPLSGAEASLLLLLHREKEAGSVIHAPSRSNSQLRGEARGRCRGGAALGWSGLVWKLREEERNVAGVPILADMIWRGGSTASRRRRGSAHRRRCSGGAEDGEGGLRDSQGQEEPILGVNQGRGRPEGGALR